jgi:hypothetical protein
MVKYKESVKASWKTLAERFRTFRKNFVRDFIGIFGSILILVFVTVAGVIFCIADKFNRKKGKDTFLHR